MIIRCSLLIDFSVSKAGTIKITAKKAGKTYARIKDRWGAGLDLRVYVKDTRLVLGSYKKEIKAGEEIQVEVYDYYKNVKSINKSNNNVSAYIKDYSKTQKSLMIRGKSGGETILWLEDYEGNKAKIELIVKGKTVSESVEKETSTGNVRYIRDFSGGSNRNAGVHWIEIQALEQKTGTNVALGKKVFGKIDSISSRPYSRITDGKLDGNNYTEGPYGEANYVTVDLGKLYDISTVKVWHYYPDGGTGRIYEKTKTEVSADGKNWKVLFDSAVSGTYVEPKDGSGRSYDVKSNASETPATEVSELEKGLEDLFEDFGVKINSIDNEGIEINSQNVEADFIKYKPKFDAFVKLVREKYHTKIPYLVKKFKVYRFVYKDNQLLVKLIDYTVPRLEKAEIKNIEYTATIDNGYLGGLYFETIGVIKEYGYQFISYEEKNNVKTLHREVISESRKEKLETFSYSTIINPQCRNGCDIYVRSYVVGVGGEKVYSEPKWIKYNGGNNYRLEQKDFLLFSNGSKEVARIENGVQINAVPVFIYVGVTWLGLGAVTTSCGGDMIDINCALSILPVEALQATRFAKYTGNELKKGVLWLNNKRRATQHLAKFGKSINDTMLGINKFVFKDFLKVNPSYKDIKNGKAAFIGWKSSTFSSKVISQSVDLILNDPNKMIHIFQTKHKLDPVINKLGGKKEFLIAVMNKANSKFPTSGVFEKVNPVIVQLEGYSIYIQGSIVNGIPRIGTIYIP